MEFPKILTKVLSHENHPKQMFLSLVISPGEILGAVWQQGSAGKTEIAATAKELVAADSWEERIIAADKVVSALEEKVPGVILTKAVLGLPTDYLTEEGDVESGVKPEIKKLTKELELTPIGFVSVHQALIHKLKADEGVPPSVILINVKKDGLTIYLYKIGSLLGARTVKRDDIAGNVENVLKSFTELEVLPSRILLYGADNTDLAEVKLLLLKHPWPTRANFLHFPKIEILPEDTTPVAVSFAGASEMKSTAGLALEDNLPQSEERVAAQPEVTREAAPEPEPVTEEVPEEIHAEPEIAEESNIEMVEPEMLGFKKSEDVLEESQKSKVKSQKFDEEEIQEKAGESYEEERVAKSKFKIPLLTKIPTFDLSKISSVFSAIRMGGNKLPLLGAGVLIILSLFAVYWFFPHAKVKILMLAKPLEKTATVTFSPTATVADAGNMIIPGQKVEQTLSGSKTIPVTGQKQVGDPAKGSVTIYNHDTSGPKTFPKGSILTAGSLQFTLDSDVTVASASSSGGFDSRTITFSKATGNITAAQIGTASNLPTGTEFDFQDISPNDAVARNDQPLTGGTSKTVTVVSRDDYNNLVKSLTNDLVAKAKGELASSVSGQTRLLEDTVTSAVTSKNFSQEIDQQASQLQGDLTVTVAGLSYNEDDVLTLMKGLVGDQLPNGYSFPTTGQINVAKTTVKKDGTVVATVNFHADAVPTFDIPGIQKKLAGKSFDAARAYLKSITGVGGAELDFGWNILGKRMPVNAKNISVTVGTQ